MERVKPLLSHGADANATGMTADAAALCWTKRQCGVALLLLERGTDVHATDNYGKTPLHYAAAKGK